MSDSDSDDEKPAPKKAVPVVAKKSPALAPKRARDSDSDSDDDKPKKTVKPRTASPALAAKKAISESPKKAPAKLETLRLPATTKEYSIDEAIPLGSHDLVSGIVADIVAEQRAAGSVSAASVGQELVLRYQKRIGKAVAQAIAPVLAQQGI